MEQPSGIQSFWIMKYSDADKERMLSYPILSLLSVNGRRTDRRGPLYFSPFRDEKVGSFKIDTARNVWYDHGEGCGGNVFTLAQRLLDLPDHRRGEAWDYLASLDPAVTVQDTPSPSSYRQSGSSRIVIDRVRKDMPGFITRYAQARGIGADILQRYCSAVTFHVEGSHKAITAIGFPSGEDGWVLRRATDRRGVPFQKRCTASAVTLFGPDGRRIRESSHGEVVVFEGFFDFLSWLEDRGITNPMCDVCVLNSVSNTSRAMDFLLSHRRIVTLLDNDRAGREHTERIREAALGAGAEFRDDSPGMGECKDMNEYLLSKRQGQTIRHNP